MHAITITLEIPDGARLHSILGSVAAGPVPWGAVPTSPPGLLIASVLGE